MQVEMRARSISELRDTLRGFKDSIVSSHTAALKSATKRLVSIGDYPPGRVEASEGEGVNWLKATTEDRIFGLIATRIISFDAGKHYRMECTCERCDRKHTKNVDLRRIEDGGDLVCWDFEDEKHREAFKNGAPFEGKLGEKTVKWRMAYGEDELLIERLCQNNPKAKTDELNLNARIVEVSDMHRNDVMKWIESMGDERIDLQDLMAEATHGVDLVINVKCPWCNGPGESTIPFDLEFWIPMVATERDRRQRRRDKALLRAQTL
jgi:hypothetical protein